VPELLPVGQPISVTLNAPPIANIFAKGHRIRVDISGSNFPKYDVNPQTGQNPANATERRVATAILQFGGAQGARLILSVCQS
jgi:predicted acyl esterase